MSRAKPAQVRYYIDADLLGLAKLLITVRSDVTFPTDPGGVVFRRQRPQCPIKSTAVKDKDWIPEVTGRGWLIITRDRNIQAHRAEIGAVREHGARMVALVGEKAKSVWDQLEIVMCQWRKLERLLEEQGPYIYAASRTSLRKVPLD